MLCFSAESTAKHGRTVASFREPFERDLNPLTPGFPSTLGELALRLKVWRTRLQNTLDETMPACLHLEAESRNLQVSHSCILLTCRQEKDFDHYMHVMHSCWYGAWLCLQRCSYVIHMVASVLRGSPLNFMTLQPDLVLVSLTLPQQQLQSPSRHPLCHSPSAIRSAASSRPCICKPLKWPSTDGCCDGLWSIRSRAYQRWRCLASISEAPR